MCSQFQISFLLLSRALYPGFLWLVVPVVVLMLALMLVSFKQPLAGVFDTVKSNTRSLDSKPELRDLLSLRCGDELLKVVSSVTTECVKFGTLLGIERHTVNIEWNSPIFNLESKCQRIFECWLDGRGRKVTWRALIETLNEFGHTAMVDQLSHCIT